jgi:hypothetical protein
MGMHGLFAQAFEIMQCTSVRVSMPTLQALANAQSQAGISG